MDTVTFSINGPMISGQVEQAVRTYKKIVGAKSTWYVSVQENAADNVYCTSNVRKPGERSQGFGGATLTFKMDDGTEDQVQGPWHSSSESLFLDTMYDVRDKCLTRGICAKSVKHDYFSGDEYSEVLHYDENPTLGEYSRIEDMAQKFANDLNCRIFYAMKSSGGGNSHFKDPK